MTDAIENFIEAMRDQNCAPRDAEAIQADDVRRYYDLAEDKPGTRKGSYQLRIDPDGFATGWFRSHREGITHPFHSKAARKSTPEERAEWKRRAEQARRDAQAAQESREAAAASRATRLWDRASKAGSTAYSTRKSIRLNGARVMGDTIVVPIRRGAEIVSLQFIAEDGSKKFLKEGGMEGSYFSLATGKDDLGHILIAEGYATACTIRQALEMPVICAFNAGNLPHVAKAIRSKYPDAVITFFADNDQWRTNQKGEPENLGLIKAQEAAVAIGGARVLAPNVPHDHPERPTDWNDVGEEAVREAFHAPIPDHRDPMPDDMLPEYDYDDQPVGLSYEDEDPLHLVNPQGHNDGTYYFYPLESGQITGLSAPGLNSIQNLYRLAPRSFWERAYGMGGEVSDKKICALASAALMDACHRRGIYLPETTRGVGVWIDGGKVAVNTGDAVVYEGVSKMPAEFRGEYVYESGPRVMRLATEPLRNAEADKLRQICKRLSWKRDIYADLLAGFLVVAAVGGAVPWRPHIWITGPSGAGKSTVMKEVIGTVLRQIAVLREGGTTEAAVRKALGRSSRPYVLDEAESESPRAKANMQAILTIARIASSGGLIENANDKFRAQSCFCFCSINPGVEQLADESRITLLSLDKDSTPGSADRYAKLLVMIRETLTPEYSARLMARTVANIDALLANTATFSLAAAAAFGSARSGDQIGPLLAGAFMLTSTRQVTLQEAKSWIAAQEWSWHEGNDDGQSDSHRCLAHMMAARVRYDVSGAARESSLGELVERAVRDIGDPQQTAKDALKGYGIKVSDGRLYIANQSSPLKRIMADTPWGVWKSALERFPGADNAGGRTMYFAPGLKVRAVSIPVADVLAPAQAGDWDTVEPEEVI